MKLLSTLITAAAVVVSPVAVAATAQAAPDDVRKPAAYTVTAKVNTQEMDLGEGVVKIRGKVKPRAAGKKVYLEQRGAGRKKWTVTTKASIRPNGTYLFLDVPEVYGTHQYRVVKLRSNGLRRGTSPVVAVRVYEWQKLAQRPRGAFENIAVSSTALVDGQPYAFSFQPFTRGAPSYVEYPLRGLCTDLRATYAMHDSAAAGSSSRITLALDGVTKVDQTIVKGQVVVGSDIDLTGALTLRYDLFSNVEPVSYPAVLVPEVRCTR